MNLTPIIFIIVVASIVMPTYAETEYCTNSPHVKYSIVNGKVIDCDVDVKSEGIIVKIEAGSDGQLTVKIPKNIGWDDVCNNDKLFILVDGAEVEIKEENTIFSRTMIIPFEDGDTQVEMIGSFAGVTYDPEVLTCDIKYSPKQQISSGTTPDEVICNRDFILLQKNSDNSVACVIPSTAETLVFRDWGSQIYHYDSDEIATESGTETVNYRIRNGFVENITVDSQARSMIVEMNSSEDGKIIIIIPRTLLDARLGPDGYSGEDDSFFVLIDGLEIKYAERVDHFNRELAIPFMSGSRQIEIIGSFPLSQELTTTNSTNR